MAKTLTPLDANVIIGEIAKEATGQSAFASVTTDDFVSVGETILRTGAENTLNALGMVMGRLISAARPYSGKLRVIDEADSGAFTQRRRKISYYAQDPQASGAWNTQLYTNLAAGFDNGENPSGGVAQSTKSMWEQTPGMPLEMDFYSHNVWSDSITRYYDQLKVAFRDQAEFIKLIDGIMQEKANDIEQQREANRRMTLLNYLAGLYDCNQNVQAVNLVTAYNTRFQTTKTATDLLTTDIKSFLEFLVATIKMYSNMFEYRSVDNHWTVQKTVGGQTYDILRHTPKSRQKLVLYRPLILEAETMVMPEIFNDEWLRLENYEGVDFWQAMNSPSIDVTPSVPDIVGGTGYQIQGSQVQLDYVVGCLFDTDACLDTNMFEDSLATPIEARKKYSNIFWHFNHGSINDFTEKGILFYIA